MKDKIVLITGSNAGIGFATAQTLAKMGARLILVARNEEKIKTAAESIKGSTANKNISWYVADLSSQKSIRDLVAAVKKDFTKIDVLINNAGGTFTDFQLSEDGIEMTIATNHFAYFLLTNLLLDLVKKSDAGRIVNVASGSSFQGKIDFESFTKNKNYFVLRAYSQSKLANVLFTFELAERLKGTGITVNCLHPGFVKTHIGNKNSNWYSSLAWNLGMLFGAISPEDGAKTSVYLASSDEVKDVSGKYFDECKEKEPPRSANDKALQKELWVVSERLCPVN